MKAAQVAAGGTVPGFLVQATLEGARREGLELTACAANLTHAGASEAAHYALPTADFLALLARLRELGGSAVGLSLGRRIMEANLHVFGPVITASRSMREAYEHCDRLSQALNAVSIGTLSTHGEEMRFHFRPMVFGPVWEDVMVSLCFHVTQRFIAGGGTSTAGDGLDLMAYFERAENTGLSEYEACFGGRVRFSSGSNGVGFPRAFFDAARPGTDTALATELCELGLRRLSKAAADAQWSDRVSGALRELGDLTQVDFDCLASRWGLNLRTLRRRLAAEGTGPTELLDAVRFERARYYLENTKAPIAEVATMLGYAEATSLGRAFKRWAGVSPQSYRAQRGGDQRHDP